MLDKQGKLLRNYTQNIDTLEQVAGVQRIIQCHGECYNLSCFSHTALIANLHMLVKVTYSYNTQRKSSGLGVRSHTLSSYVSTQSDQEPQLLRYLIRKHAVKTFSLSL